MLDRPENVQIRENYNTSMIANSMKTLPDLMKCYPWGELPPASKVVDIGGGRGHLIKEIASVNASITPSIFDIAKVIEEAKQFLSSSKQKFELIEGDFFVSVP